MAIDGINDYIIKNKLFKSEAVPTTSRRIGIDASYWVHQLVERVPSIKLHHVRSGSIPHALLQVVQEQLVLMKKCGMDPIFVFHGIELVDFSFKEFKPHQKSILKTFEDEPSFPICQSLLNEYLAVVLTFLKEKKYNAFRAPYYAWPQLLYLKEQGVVHDLFADLDLVLLAAPALNSWILEMDLKQQIQARVDMTTLIERTTLDCGTLADCALLAGGMLTESSAFLCSLTREYGNIFEYAIKQVENKSLAFIFNEERKMNPSFSLDTTRSMVQKGVVFEKTFQSIIPFDTTAVVELTTPPTSYLSYTVLYAQAFPKVMKAHVDNTRPLTLPDYLGTPFSFLTYFLLLHGVLSPTCLSLVARGYDTDHFPLLDSSQYRTALTSLRSLRSLAVDQLCHHFPCAFESLCVYHLNLEMHSMPVNPRHLNNLQVRMHKPLHLMQKAASLMVVLHSLPQSKMTPWHGQLDHPHELGALFQINLLKVLQHFIGPNLSLDKKALSLSKLNPSAELQAPSLVLLLQLLSDSLLNANPIVDASIQTSKDSRAPPFSPEIMLVARILSVFPEPMDPAMGSFSWKHLGHRSFTAWSSIVNAYLAAARDTYDSLLLSLLQDHASSCQDVLQSDSFSALDLAHPFRFRPSNFLGQLMALYLAHPQYHLSSLADHFFPSFSQDALYRFIKDAFEFWMVTYPVLRDAADDAFCRSLDASHAVVYTAYHRFYTQITVPPPPHVRAPPHQPVVHE